MTPSTEITVKGILRDAQSITLTVQHTGTDEAALTRALLQAPIPAGKTPRPPEVAEALALGLLGAPGAMLTVIYVPVDEPTSDYYPAEIVSVEVDGMWAEEAVDILRSPVATARATRRLLLSPQRRGVSKPNSGVYLVEGQGSSAVRVRASDAALAWWGALDSIQRGILVEQLYAETL